MPTLRSLRKLLVIVLFAGTPSIATAGGIMDIVQHTIPGNLPYIADAKEAWDSTPLAGGGTVTIGTYTGALTNTTGRVHYISRIDPTGNTVWVRQLLAIGDSPIARVKQSPIDSDIYVLLGEGLYGSPIALRLDLATGNIIWLTHTIPDYSIPSNGGADFWIDFVFRPDGMYAFGATVTTSAMPNQPRQYMLEFARLNYANGLITDRHTYAAPPTKFGSLNVIPVRAVEDKVNGTLVDRIRIFANYYDANFNPVYIGEINFNPIIRQWQGYGQYFKIETGTGALRVNHQAVLLDARILPDRTRIITGLLKNGPFGGKDIFVSRMPLTNGASTPTFHIYGTALDDAGQSIVTSSFTGPFNYYVALALENLTGDLFQRGDRIGALELSSTFVPTGYRYTSHFGGALNDVEFNGQSVYFFGESRQFNSPTHNEVLADWPPAANADGTLCGVEPLSVQHVSVTIQTERLNPFPKRNLTTHYQPIQPNWSGQQTLSLMCPF